jgi:hypothetical protein
VFDPKQNISNFYQETRQSVPLMIVKMITTDIQRKLQDHPDFVELLIRFYPKTEVTKNPPKIIEHYERFNAHRRRKTASRAVPSGQRRRKNKAAWISHMNFASLLNLPGVMQRYGSLRVLWEGDRKGEGGLPRLKSKVKKGVTGNWSASASRAVVSETALERVIESAASACNSGSPEASVQQLLDAAKLISGQSGTHIYKKLQNI